MSFEIQDDVFWNNAGESSHEMFSSTFDEALKNQDLIKLLIVEKDGEAIGFANLLTIFSVWSHGKALILDDLYIKENMRGQGIGRDIMKYIERYGNEQGVKRLQFQSEKTNPEAHNFYTHLGYKSEIMNFYVKYL